MVTIGGTPATQVAFTNSTTLTAQAPAGTVGAQDVIVTNPDGQEKQHTGGWVHLSHRAHHHTATHTDQSAVIGQPATFNTHRGGVNAFVSMVTQQRWRNELVPCDQRNSQFIYIVFAGAVGQWREISMRGGQSCEHCREQYCDAHTVTVAPVAPSITQQPTGSKHHRRGQPAIFSITATGSTPLLGPTNGGAAMTAVLLTAIFPERRAPAICCLPLRSPTVEPNLSASSPTPSEMQRATPRHSP